MELNCSDGYHKFGFEINKVWGFSDQEYDFHCQYQRILNTQLAASLSENVIMVVFSEMKHFTT